MPIAALAIPAAISVGTSIFKGITGSSAAKKAAEQQAAASLAAQVNSSEAPLPASTAPVGRPCSWAAAAQKPA